LQNIIINPQDFILINRTQTNIALNNNFDEVRLYNPNNDLVDQITYNDVSEGFSYSKFDNTWQWTNNPTPLGQNIISTTESRQDNLQSQAQPVQASENVDLLITQKPEDQKPIEIVYNYIDFSGLKQADIKDFPKLVNAFKPTGEVIGKVAGASNSSSVTPLIYPIYYGILMYSIFNIFLQWQITLRKKNLKISPKISPPG